MTEPSSGEIIERGSSRRDAMLDALSRLSQPFVSAFDVWGRAVNGAMGNGPGVYDDEIVPAGLTLGSMAMTGSVAAGRPAGSLGAGGRPWTREELEKLSELRAAGLYEKQIAHEIGRSDAAIGGAARYHGIGPSQARASNRSDLVREGWAAGKTIPEIAASANMHPRTVQKMARTLGLEARGPGRPRKADTHNAMLLGGLGMAGSPYDEDAYMPVPTANDWLNNRLRSRVPDLMGDYLLEGFDPRDLRGNVEQMVNRRGSQPGGSDMDMMMMYGPEDQVAYDQNGRPIPLNDPRHPNNQQQVNPMLRSYPQQRR